MNRKKLLLIIAASVLSYFIGEQLKQIYGLDPPYIYYDSGLLLQGSAILTGIIAFIYLTVSSIKGKD